MISPLYCMISIHAPARGATIILGHITTSQKFQSTLPRGERRCCTASSLAAASLFQSTLPRGERRCRTGRVIQILGISIHAPARGATHLRHFFGRSGCISIHAPARGATRGRSGDGKILEHFNPRSREGSDPATRCLLCLQSEFQSTLPRGERLCRTTSAA